MKNGKRSKADGRLRAKEAWFDAGTAAFERVFPGARARVYPELESPYICPLCGEPFPRDLVLLPPHGRDMTFYDRIAPLISGPDTNLNLQGDRYYWPKEPKHTLDVQSFDSPVGAANAGRRPHAELSPWRRSSPRRRRRRTN